MATEYVIVIEVDQNDAARKYAEGKRSLDAIWRRLMRVAEKLDSHTISTHEKYRKSYEERIPNGYPYPALRNDLLYAPDLRTEMRKLESRLAMSRTAISSFRMEESEVDLMNRYGSGVRCTELMRKFSLL